ncbi:hypothetical protein PSM7751_02581 [Pseudooceanicola marinus]|uniref:Outer membrane protein beta-barrel domain-containing protein n=1 Tax=Pseudooceanicola marinus TaxID=396013 RepID=A0A1X6ZKA8_9RHOB|nr:outer membrane beta-barrel protein [Pseudooceanicola marinus]SLN53552.1 hypothetical protein PSM7751_02581 [Pseudooceanicola marinus]
MTRFAPPLLTMFALALPAAPALAQSAPPPAEAWQGIYGGLKAEAFSGDRVGYNYVYQGQTVEMPYGLTETTELGAFLGYNFVYGNVVFGPEVAFTEGGPKEELTPVYRMHDALDLKLRVGYVTGRALLYGFAGYSQSAWDDGWDVSDVDGKIYGVGVDVLFDSGAFAGLEYARRDMEGHYIYGDDYVTLDTTSLSLRVGYKF